ncbi:hypothetical protein KC350_g78 [Hortaea werneckii]|nr:hypothetical protein KC350_g78 [Hortaea werneckii]
MAMKSALFISSGWAVWLFPPSAARRCCSARSRRRRSACSERSSSCCNSRGKASRNSLLHDHFLTHVLWDGFQKVTINTERSNVNLPAADGRSYLLHRLLRLCGCALRMGFSCRFALALLNTFHGGTASLGRLAGFLLTLSSFFAFFGFTFFPFLLLASFAFSLFGLGLLALLLASFFFGLSSNTLRLFVLLLGFHSRRHKNAKHGRDDSRCLFMRATVGVRWNSTARASAALSAGLPSLPKRCERDQSPKRPPSCSRIGREGSMSMRASFHVAKADINCAMATCADCRNKVLKDVTSRHTDASTAGSASLVRLITASASFALEQRVGAVVFASSSGSCAMGAEGGITTAKHGKHISQGTWRSMVVMPPISSSSSSSSISVSGAKLLLNRKLTFILRWHFIFKIVIFAITHVDADESILLAIGSIIAPDDVRQMLKRTAMRRSVHVVVVSFLPRIFTSSPSSSSESPDSSSSSPSSSSISSSSSSPSPSMTTSMSMSTSPGMPSTSPMPLLSSSSSSLTTSPWPGSSRSSPSTSPSSSSSSSSDSSSSPPPDSSIPRAVLRRRSGVGSRSSSSSPSDMDVAEEMSSSSVLVPGALDDISEFWLRVTPRSVSCLRGPSMYLTARFAFGKLRSISAMAEVRAPIPLLSLLLSMRLKSSPSPNSLEYRKSRGSVDVVASLKARNACSKTNLRTNVRSVSSSEESAPRVYLLLFSVLFEQRDTRTVVAQFDVNETVEQIVEHSSTGLHWRCWSSLWLAREIDELNLCPPWVCSSGLKTGLSGLAAFSAPGAAEEAFKVGVGGAGVGVAESSSISTSSRGPLGFSPLAQRLGLGLLLLVCCVVFASGFDTWLRWSLGLFTLAILTSWLCRSIFFERQRLASVGGAIVSNNLQHIFSDFDEHLGVAQDQMVQIAGIGRCVHSTVRPMTFECGLDLTLEFVINRASQLADHQEKPLHRLFLTEPNGKLAASRSIATNASKSVERSSDETIGSGMWSRRNRGPEGSVPPNTNVLPISARGLAPSPLLATAALMRSESSNVMPGTALKTSRQRSISESRKSLRFSSRSSTVMKGCLVTSCDAEDVLHSANAGHSHQIVMWNVANCTTERTRIIIVRHGVVLRLLRLRRSRIAVRIFHIHGLIRRRLCFVVVRFSLGNGEARSGIVSSQNGVVARAILFAVAPVDCLPCKTAVVDSAFHGWNPLGVTLPQGELCTLSPRVSIASELHSFCTAGRIVALSSTTNWPAMK